MATNNDNCVDLMSGTLVRPIARYPASVAADSALKVASNRVQTTLVGAVGAGDTLWTMGDTSRLVPDMLLSIDSEIVSITVINGNVITVVRGFDGTQPSSHASGRTASANITAWHHNTLAAEITAIEQALGPNLSNVGSGSGSGSGLGAISNCAYMFASQSPGGNLVVGLNVITLTPVPQGVNGTNAGHPLYISGGTGAAESVAIGGGTAVSGAASGTVIVTCVNAHSGAWTIGTATGGIQEAIGSLPSAGGEVIVSCDVTLHASVVSLGKKVLVKKLAAQLLTNIGAPYSVLGSVVYDPSADCTYATDAVGFGTVSDTAPVVWPYDPSVKIVRALQGTDPKYTQGYSATALAVQEDFNGPTGTPFALRVQLNCPNITSSYGIAAIAGYCETGAGSGTIAIGVHGDASSHSPNTVSIGVNSEGTYLGTAPGGTMYGYVSNLGAGNTFATEMVGAYVICNANPGGAPNVGGGVNIAANISGSHKYGLYVSETGGTFEQQAIFHSTQLNSNNVVLNNNAPGSGASSSNILFRRTPLPLTTPTSNVVARISASNLAGTFAAGALEFSTSNGSDVLKPALTIDAAQAVTVANSVRTTPIHAVALPSAASSIGCWACVDDATNNTVGAVVAGGGGSNKVAVFCSARGWVIVAN